jgi:hypothetical protein
MTTEQITNPAGADTAPELTPGQRELLVAKVCAELDGLATKMTGLGVPAEDVLMAFAETAGRLAWKLGGAEFSVKFMASTAATWAQLAARDQPKAN